MQNQEIAGLLEVVLPERSSFLAVKETLTRCGLVQHDKGERPILKQICYIFHTRGRYFITTAPELENINRTTKIPLRDIDVERRNLIASLLASWKMLTIKEPEKFAPPKFGRLGIRTVRFQDAGRYRLVSGHTFKRPTTEECVECTE